MLCRRFRTCVADKCRPRSTSPTRREGPHDRRRDAGSPLCRASVWPKISSGDPPPRRRRAPLAAESSAFDARPGSRCSIPRLPFEPPGAGVPKSGTAKPRLGSADTACPPPTPGQAARGRPRRGPVHRGTSGRRSPRSVALTLARHQASLPDLDSARRCPQVELRDPNAGRGRPRRRPCRAAASTLDPEAPRAEGPCCHFPRACPRGSHEDAPAERVSFSRACPR